MLCVGTTAELCAQIVRSAGRDAAVLVVSDVASALELLKNDQPNLSTVLAETVRHAIEFGPLRLDTGVREASWRGRPIELSARQFDLLTALAGEGERVWTYADLTREVWQRRYVGDVDAVVSAVKRLRRRLSAVTDELTIASVRGVGYRLAVLGRHP